MCFRESAFFCSISEFLVAAPIVSPRDKNDMYQAVNSLMFLLNFYMETLPTDSKSRVQVIIMVIENNIAPLLNANGREEIESEMTAIKEKNIILARMLIKCPRVDLRVKDKNGSSLQRVTRY